MVVNGLPLVGKSTTIHRVVHCSSDTINEIHLPSTKICEKPLRVVIEPLTQRRVAVSSSWVEQTPEIEQDRLTEKTLSLVDNTDVHELDTTQSHLPSASNDLKTDTLSNTSKHSTTEETSQQNFSSRQGSSSFEPSSSTQLADKKDSILSFDTPDDIVRTALRKISTLRSQPGDDQIMNILNIIDTGGQPEFLEVLPMLLVVPSINVQVFKLNEKLDERFVVEFVPRHGETTEPYVSSYTVEQALFQAMSCVGCLSPSPQVHHRKLPDGIPAPQCVETLFVGTHRDCVSDDEFRKYDDTLQDRLDSCSLPENHKVRYYRNKKTQSYNVIFPIDNTKAEASGIEQLKEEIHNILEKEVRPHKVILSWEWFRQAVLSTRAKIITVDQCVIIGTECGMEDKEEVLLALWYHTHYTGQLRHYPNIEGLEDIVFLDPQVFSDAMTTLISSAFHSNGSLYQDDVRYRNTGRFPKAEVEWMLACACENLRHNELVALFKHLHIFRPITDSCKEVVEYFIPCVLKTAEVENKRRECTSELHPAPLLFEFDSGFTPIGIFPALIVHLWSHVPMWELCSPEEHVGSSPNSSRNPPLFRNLVTFTVGEDLDVVTLIARPTCYEVWFDREDNTDCQRLFVDVCNDVRLTIDKALTHVKSSCLNSSIQSSHRATFYCNREKCLGKIHSANPRGNPPTDAICPVSKQRSVLREDQRIWYGVQNNQVW